jgi:flagellar basal-body rod modification protein FlgD
MSAIPSFTNSNTTNTAAGNAFSALNSEQFVKIIFTELQQQDPLQPSDSKDLLAQLSSLRSIQSDMELGSRMNSLVAQNQLSSASNLIGKYISGIDDQFRRVEGQVGSISRTAEGTVLNLRNGARVNMNDLDQVLETPPGNNGSGNPPANS